MIILSKKNEGKCQPRSCPSFPNSNAWWGRGGGGTVHLLNRQPAHLNSGNLKQTLGSPSQKLFFCCSQCWLGFLGSCIIPFPTFWGHTVLLFIGVVYTLRNHFWWPKRPPPPLCNIVIIWASPPCNTVIILPFISSPFHLTS